MNPKHTPGLWENAGHEESYNARSPIRIVADDGVEIAVVTWQGSSDEQEANADLVTAAPDLLEAAEALLDPRCTDAWVKLRAAIAKAKGETP